MPWGRTNMPAPKLLTALPDASNFTIGDTFDPTQSFAPHRSNTHTLAPSGSIVIPAVDPTFRPSGMTK
jgi:hypothetical protein